MTLDEMSKKFEGGSIKSKSLEQVVSGGSAEDFVADGALCKIVEISSKGYYDTRVSENAVFVIMQACKRKDDGTIEELDQAIQVPLGLFDRSAVGYKKLADGTVERDPNIEPARADGDVVTDWKRAANAKAFMTTHMGKVFEVKLKATIPVRAWDRVNNTWSNTQLRDQKVFTCKWVA